VRRHTGEQIAEVKRLEQTEGEKLPCEAPCGSHIGGHKQYRHCCTDAYNSSYVREGRILNTDCTVVAPTL